MVVSRLEKEGRGEGREGGREGRREGKERERESRPHLPLSRGQEGRKEKGKHNPPKKIETETERDREEEREGRREGGRERLGKTRHRYRSWGRPICPNFNKKPPRLSLANTARFSTMGGREGGGGEGDRRGI